MNIYFNNLIFQIKMMLEISSAILKYLIIIMLIYIILQYIKKIPFYKESLRLPGPPALPFIGNAYYFTGNTAGIKNIYI
jgi:hypothetical protein